MRLATPTQFMARDRTIVEESFPGDVVGIHDTGTLEIGDTLTGGSRFVFEGIPSFAPEHFRRLALVDPLRRKQFARGIEQLAQEGTVQLYRPPAGRAGDLVLGALGQLQFEVVKYRLESEYGVEVRVEPVPCQLARWVSLADGKPLDLDEFPSGGRGAGRARRARPAGRALRSRVGAPHRGAVPPGAPVRGDRERRRGAGGLT